MKILTKHFGEVEISEDKVLTFEKGVFGFEENKKYIILYDNNENENNVFCWLQSVEDVNISLPIINPMLFYPTYSPEVSDEEVLKLGELEENRLEVYSVVVIPEDITKMTINLKAPIIINNKTKKCAQLIAEGDNYEIRHNLYEQFEIMKKLKKAEGE